MSRIAKNTRSITLTTPPHARRLLLAAITAATLLAGGCDKLNEEKAASNSDYVARAEEYRQQGQYRAALIEARNAVAASRENLAGRLELARLLNELGQARQTLKLFENAAAAELQNPEVNIVRADAFLQLGKFRSALALFEHTDSTSAEARLRIAKAKAGLGQIADARILLDELQSTALATDAQLLRARIELGQGNLNDVDAILSDVLKQQPDNIDALTIGAKKEELAGKLDKAESMLSQALMKLPQSDLLLPQKVNVLQNLTTVLTKQGRSTESLIYAKVLSDANPEGMEIQNKLKQGLEAFGEGNLDNAEQLVKEAYDRSRNDYAGILLGMIKYRKHDFAAASEYFEAHIDPETAPSEALSAFVRSEISQQQAHKLLDVITPEQRERINDPEVKALLGVALIQSGDAHAGEATLRDALESAAGNAAIRATLARHYLLSQQAQKSVDLLKQHPGNANDPTILRLLTSSYIALGNMPMALETAQKIADTKPEQAAGYHVLGRTALIAKKFDISQKALQHALQLQPGYRPAQFDLAQLLLLQKTPQAAESIYRELLRVNSSDAAAIKGFINARVLQGDAVQGNAVLENNTARQLEADVIHVSDTDAARAVLAEYYLRKGSSDQAKRLLDSVNAPAPDSYAAKIKQLVAQQDSLQLLQRGDFDGARQTAFDGLRLNPRNSDLLTTLARIEIKAKSFTEAEKIIGQIAQIEPGAPIIADLRASLASAQGEKAGAIAQLRTLWSQVKSDDTAFKLYQGLAENGDDAAATRFLQEWQAALPNSDVPLFLQGMQLQQDGKKPQAVSFYETAIAKNPRNALALNNLALIYLEQGNTQAAALAEKASVIAPGNPAILDTYGLILVKTGNKEKGLLLLQQALQLSPNNDDIKAHVNAAQNTP